MYEKIKISPVSFLTLLKCEIFKRPNQHIKIKAEGYIDTLEDMLYTDWKKEEIQVYFIDEKGEKERVFCGMMELWTVEEMGALKNCILRQSLILFGWIGRNGCGYFKSRIKDLKKSLLFLLIVIQRVPVYLQRIYIKKRIAYLYSIRKQTGNF